MQVVTHGAEPFDPQLERVDDRLLGRCDVVDRHQRDGLGRQHRVRHGQPGQPLVRPLDCQHVRDTHPVEDTVAGGRRVQIGVEVDVDQSNTGPVGDRAGHGAQLDSAIAAQHEDIVTVGERVRHLFGHAADDRGDCVGVPGGRMSVIGLPVRAGHIAAVVHDQTTTAQQLDQTVPPEDGRRSLLARPVGTRTGRRTHQRHVTTRRVDAHLNGPPRLSSSSAAARPAPLLDGS